MWRGTGTAVLTMVFFLAMASPGQSAVLGVGVTGKAGTTGLGVDLTLPLITNWVNLRLGYNNLSYFSTSIDDLGGVDYQADLEFQDAPLFIDVHPFHGNFRVTGGVFWLDHDAILTASGQNIRVGNNTYNATFRADIQHGQDFGPYLGIGWGNAADDNFLDLPVAIGFSMDLGVIYVGDSEVSLTQVSGSSISQSDLDREARQLEDDLSDVPFYPVFTIGLHIRF
ncbi:Putative Outer membrane protein domain-containing protein [Nitrospina watsonii]|uniref:Outer membrane protein domain-containing protein n=2 Tax=Nitrospina watsonii TaxID=1323948 RepID=A0ABM9HB75_9BACT|nr:Putative Outer membrane protein domain-containing protein [Nitrospina watsonii]